MDPLYLTAREFARRVNLKPNYVRELLRRRLIVGAQKTLTGRWRIPVATVAAFLRGALPIEPTSAPTADEMCNQLWLQYEGRPYAPPDLRPERALVG